MVLCALVLAYVLPRNAAAADEQALHRIAALTEDLLAENDGFCGLNLCTDFLGRGRDIDAVTAHAEHFLSLGMEKNLGLGTDFDGIPETPAGIRGVESMGEVYEAMLRKNWSEDLVRDIFYNNLHDYLRRAVG